MVKNTHTHTHSLSSCPHTHAFTKNRLDSPVSLMCTCLDQAWVCNCDKCAVKHTDQIKVCVLTSKREKKQVDVTRQMFAQDPEISHRNFLLVRKWHISKAASAVQQRWLLSLPSGQKDGDFHQLCKRHIFKIIEMLDVHGDGLKMRDSSYMIECNQSHFYFILYLYLHFIR